MIGIIARTFREIVIRDSSVSYCEYEDLLFKFKDLFHKGLTLSKKIVNKVNSKEEYIKLLCGKINCTYQINDYNLIDLIQFIYLKDYREYMFLLEILSKTVKNVLVEDKLFNIIEYLLILVNNVRDDEEVRPESLKKLVSILLQTIILDTDTLNLNDLLHEDYTILYRAIEQNSLVIAKILINKRCNIFENISQKSINKKTIFCWYIDNLYSNMRTLTIDKINEHKEFLSFLARRHKIFFTSTRLKRNEIIKIQYYFNSINSEPYFTMGIKEDFSSLSKRFPSNSIHRGDHELVKLVIRRILSKKEVIASIIILLNVLKKIIDEYIFSIEDSELSFISFLNKFEPNFKQYINVALKDFYHEHISLLLVVLIEIYPNKKNEISILFSFLDMDYETLFDYIVKENNNTLMYIMLDIYFNNIKGDTQSKIDFLYKNMITNYKQMSLIMPFLNEHYSIIKLSCLINIIFSFDQVPQDIIKKLHFINDTKKHDSIRLCIGNIMINDRFIDYAVSNNLNKVAELIMETDESGYTVRTYFYIEMCCSSGHVQKLVNYILSNKTFEERKERIKFIIEQSVKAAFFRLLDIVLNIIQEEDKIELTLLFIDLVDMLKYKDNLLQLLKQHKTRKDQMAIIDFLCDNEASSNRLKVELLKELLPLFNINVLSNNRCILQNCIRCSNLMCLTDILKVHQDLTCSRCPGKDDFFTTSLMNVFKRSSKRLIDAREYLYETMIENGFNLESYEVPQKESKTLLRKTKVDYNIELLKDIGKKRKRDTTIEDVFPTNLYKKSKYTIDENKINLLTKQNQQLSLKIENLKNEVLQNHDNSLTNSKFTILLDKLFSVKNSFIQ